MKQLNLIISQLIYLTILTLNSNSTHLIQEVSSTHFIHELSSIN